MHRSSTVALFAVLLLACSASGAHAFMSMKACLALSEGWSGEGPISPVGECNGWLNEEEAGGPQYHIVPATETAAAQWAEARASATRVRVIGYKAVPTSLCGLGIQSINACKIIAEP